MNSNILREILRSVLSFCGVYIERHGDIPVPPRDRPFIHVSFCIDSIVNLTSPQSLTYGILKNIMQGLLDVLYLEAENCKSIGGQWYGLLSTTGKSWAYDGRQ